MIVNKIDRDVTASPAAHRQAVTIKASPDMVRRVILPYTDYAFAAVRETVTGNHMDADTRIQLKLPTKLDPVWMSRDFGPGIPQAQFRDFYAMAGHSTKADTNVIRLADGSTVAVMGCKGVGRFAPLGISDQFMIRNINDGRVVIGQVYFSSDGHPVFDIISDQPAPNEPTGVEISFAVPYDKLGQFEQAVAKSLMYAPSIYKIEWLGRTPSIERPIAKFSGPTWRITERAEATAVMGRIGYEVNPAQFTGDVKQLLEVGLEFEVPLGEIDVNDAREQLIYNDRTKATVVAAINAIRQSVLDHLFDSVNKATTLWEATVAYDKMADRVYRNTFGSVPKFKWQGQSVTRDITYDAVDIAASLNVALATTSPTAAPIQASELMLTRAKNGWYRKSRIVWEGEAYLTFKPARTVVIIVDTKSRLNDTIHEWLSNQVGSDHGEIIRIQADDPHLATKLKFLGDPPASAITRTSTMPIPLPKPVGAAGLRSITSLEIWQGSAWVKGSVDLAQPAIFQYTYGTNSRIKDTTTPLPAVPLDISFDRRDADHARYSVLPLLNKDALPIIRVPHSVETKLKRAKGWVEWNRFILEAASLRLADSAFFNLVEFEYVVRFKPYADWIHMMWNQPKLAAVLLPHNSKDRPLAVELAKARPHLDTSAKIAAIHSTFADSLKKLVDDRPHLPYLVLGKAPTAHIIDYVT